MTCSTKFSCARSRATSWRCSLAWCMAPAISRPITRSSSTSRPVNSRRATVCTFNTPTRPTGSVSMGTDTIDVKSEPRNDSNGRYRGSDSLSCTITTGSRWLATQPDTPCPNGSRILPTSASNGGVAPVSVSERSASSRTCTKQTSVPVAAVIIRAAASASGSTPGPLDAAWISSRRSASSRSASTRSRTAFSALRLPGRCLLPSGVTGRSPPAARWPRLRCGRRPRACDRSTSDGSSPSRRRSPAWWRSRDWTAR